MDAKNLPWFRMYAEAIDDEKLRLLAFEDRWHFIALLCCKGQGILDDTDPLLMRKVAVKMGVDVRTLDEIARRLAEVGLIEAATLQPAKWDDRQMRSDSSTERVRAFRERTKQTGNIDETLQKRSSNGAVTAQDTDTDTEEDKDKDKEVKKGKGATHTRKRGADSSSTIGIKELSAEGVSRQVASDWLTLRKAKRLPLTPTAWQDLKDEAAKCGMTPADAVAHAVKSNWAGFKASWVLRDNPSTGSVTPRTGAQPMNKQEALEARNRAVAEQVIAELAHASH